MSTMSLSPKEEKSPCEDQVALDSVRQKQQKPSFTLTVDAIKLFESHANTGREANGSNNEAREKVLEVLLTNAVGDFCRDETHGKAWCALRNGWRGSLLRVSKGSSRMHLTRKGGRGHNYDFDLTFPMNDEMVVKHIEFKFNAVPQFLNLGANKPFHDRSYADFFHAGDYIERILRLYGLEGEVQKPTLEVYRKAVHTNSSRLAFFVKLKEAEKAKPEHYKAKQYIVSESIEAYLECYAPNTVCEAITAELQRTQTDKVFILYKQGKFTEDSIEPEELIAQSVKGVRNGNTLVIQSARPGTEHHMLLRWKNHLGVLYPAWQIRMVRT